LEQQTGVIIAVPTLQETLGWCFFYQHDFHGMIFDDFLFTHIKLKGRSAEKTRVSCNVSTATITPSYFDDSNPW